MLTINTKEFESALSKCSKFIYKKATSEVLRGVRIEYLDNICTMAATNLENTIVVKLNSAISDSNIEFVLMDIASIGKVSKFFTDNISFDLDGDAIAVSSGNKTIKGKFIDSSEFPIIMSLDKMKIIASNNVNGLSFDKLYSKMKHAISNDDARPLLTGIHFDKDFIAASNGFTISKFDNNIIDANFTIRQDSVKSFNLIGDGILSIGYFGNDQDDQFYFFTDNNITLYGRLLTGVFPDINRVIPDLSKEHESFEIDSKDIIESLDFLIGLGAEFVKIDGNKIIGVGKDKNDKDISETEIKNLNINIIFGFNPKYVRDAIKEQLQSKFVKFDIFSSRSPFTITSSDDNNKDSGLFICMPMAIGY